jgi:hypothetical protein
MTWYSRDNIDTDSQQGPLPDGWYEATVFRTKIRTSQAGNSMQQVLYKVYLSDGSERVVSDFYVDHPKALWKYGKLASSLNASERFKDGNFDADGYTGDPIWIKLGVNDDRPEYNEVVDMAPRKVQGEVARAAAKMKPDPIDPDDIPF